MRLGKVEISPGFLLLAAWLNYMDAQRLLLPALISCTLHELGHLIVLYVLKKDVKRIRITVVGAEICVADGMSYWEEVLAALAGPGVNFFVAAVLCRLPEGAALAGMNLVLGCFNLLPVEQLDGGRALRSLMMLIFGPGRGECLAVAASWMANLGVCGLSLWLARWGGNMTLALAAAWLLTAAGQKERKGGIRACQGAGKKVQ